MGLLLSEETVGEGREGKGRKGKDGGRGDEVEKNVGVAPPMPDP